MSNQYFVYKTNHITNIGGITPSLPTTGHLGISVKRGWFLGVIDSSELNWFQTAKEFNINPCSELEAQGFQLLDVTQLPADPSDPLSETMRELTENELALQQVGEAFIAKLELRPRVTAFVGDQDDQMSDLAKRVALLERGLLMMYAVLQNESIMSAIPEPWHTLLTTAHTDFINGNLKDPIDIRPDGYMNVYNILKERGGVLTDELASYYAKAMGE
jgi:hypothetical protein